MFIDIHIICTTDTAHTLTHLTLVNNIFTSTLGMKCALPVSYAWLHQLRHTFPITLSTVGTVLSASSAYSYTQIHCRTCCRLWPSFWPSIWIFLDIVLDWIRYGPLTAFGFCCIYCIVCFVAGTGLCNSPFLYQGLQKDE